jgi:hypothetical protein
MARKYDPDTSDNEDDSLDDILEDERPDRLQHVIGQQPLPEDNDPPASPASTIGGTLSDTHPSRDSNVDPGERYHE